MAGAKDLVFYTNPMSRGRIVRWMLEELKQPYETRILGFGAPLRDPDYLVLNPMGKVPTLVHGGVVVTECAAICSYLADAFPQACLAPEPADPARGAYYRWLFFGAGPLEAAVGNAALGCEVPADKERMMGYGSLQRVLDTLQTALEGGPYLAGHRFSAADLYVGAQLGWGMTFGTIEKRPVFEAYWQQLSQRPAFERANELDTALLGK